MCRVPQLSVCWIWILGLCQAYGYISPATEPYTWNKTAVSAEYYLAGYGPVVCGVDKEKYRDEESNKFCCYSMQTFPCTCEDWCQSYGVCCSDRVPGRMTRAWDETGCLETAEDCIYAMVRCPQSWSERNIRQACETGQGKYMVDEPVTNLDTGVTYRNEFCAQCHGVGHYTIWAFNVTCSHFQYVFKARSSEEFLDMAFQDDSKCTPKIVPPEKFTPKVCPGKQWFSVVDRCNVTGGWATEDYDAEVENNCLLYKSLVLRVRYSFETYQNLFCAICNGDIPNRYVSDVLSMDLPPDPELTFLHGSSRRGHPPLSLLLGLGTRAVDSDLDDFGHGCSGGQWRDHTVSSASSNGSLISRAGARSVILDLTALEP